MFDLLSFLRSEFDEHEELISTSREHVVESLGRLVEMCVCALERGNKLLLFGNGGSAATAEHIATELMVRYKCDRDPLCASALALGTCGLTAIGNDLGFEHLFARQVKALARAGDVAIGISASGKSQNVLQALRCARSMACHAVGLTGHDVENMKFVADPLIAIPSKNIARIQEMHLLIGHMLCGAVESRLKPLI
jgi:D-sedoheptulose 7-phosphate isomerase